MPTPVFQQVSKTIELVGDGSEANGKIDVVSTYTFSDGVNLAYHTIVVEDVTAGELLEADYAQMDADAQNAVSTP